MDELVDIFYKTLDWDSKRQKYFEKGKINNYIQLLKAKNCGNCENWMKKSKCPMEEKERPSCNWSCTAFKRSDLTSKELTENLLLIK